MYHIQFEFAYADWMTPAFGAQNLAMAAGAVLVCVALFLPVSIALLCTFAVVCIDVLLLGGMALLQTPLNTITLVSLLLAMALAIDYSCHIGAPLCRRHRRCLADRWRQSAAPLPAVRCCALALRRAALSPCACCLPSPRCADAARPVSPPRVKQPSAHARAS